MLSKTPLSRKEVGELSYYDFLAYVGMPFIQFGGLEGTDELAKLCDIDQTKVVLEVGCGTGYTACYLAKTYGCQVVGIDIAKKMIEEAITRAITEKITEKVEFRVADAYEIPFEDKTFDLVITQFTAQFLDMKRALTEFNRVTKSGSYIGILEMAKDDEIPPKLKELIEEAEEITRRVTELDFRLLTPEDWKKKFEEAGMYEIQTVKLEKVSAGKYMSLIGKGRFIKLIYRATYHLLFNSKIREKFMAMGKAKRIMRNRKDTTKYLSTIVCVGRK